MLILETISFFILISWIYFILFHGRSKIFKDNFFWTSSIIFERNKLDPAKTKKKICALIPARNEENTISSTLESLKNQNLKNLHIIVIDDNSDDNTKILVEKFKKKYSKLTLIDGMKLPDGWVGKVWALKQGVDQALEKNYDYFLFIDSDIFIYPGTIEKVINFIETKNLKMLSLMAKLNCNSFWEKFLIPPFIFFFQKLFPFARVNNKNDKLSAAAGGFILCQSKLFMKNNLYEQIKSKLIDDCNIAKLIKSHGPIWLGLTNMVKSQRSYETFSSIWKMVARTAFEQLNFSIYILLICCVSMFAIYIIPYIFFVISLLCININLLIINSMILILVYLAFFPVLKFYGIKKNFLLLMPFSALIYLMMTISSAINYYSKKGNKWKGRSYQ